MCITSYAYKGVFSIEERSEDIALRKAETGRVEQCQHSNETPVILRSRVLFDFLSLPLDPLVFILIVRVEIEQK